MLKRYLTLFRALNAARIKYLVIGGLAVIAHGIPRSTKDADIVLLRSPRTYAKLLEVLKSLRFGTAYLTDPQKMMASKVTIFDDYIRVDILSEAPGLDFETFWQHREVFKVEGVRINFVNLENLIRLKKAAGRKQDREDLKLLKQIQKGRL